MEGGINILGTCCRIPHAGDRPGPRRGGSQQSERDPEVRRLRSLAKQSKQTPEKPREYKLYDDRNSPVEGTFNRLLIRNRHGAAWLLVFSPDNRNKIEVHRTALGKAKDRREDRKGTHGANRQLQVQSPLGVSLTPLAFRTCSRQMKEPFDPSRR